MGDIQQFIPASAQTATGGSGNLFTRISEGREILLQNTPNTTCSETPILDTNVSSSDSQVKWLRSELVELPYITYLVTRSELWAVIG